jgi:hypothetical protein
MAIRLLSFLLFIFSIPSTVFASDPTPLFVMFIEIPILVISCFVLFICFLSHKIGGVLLCLLLIGSFIVHAWASDVGYMDSAGNFLNLSFLIDIVSVVVIIKKKLSKLRESKPDEKV